jgi:hypothetical protein
MSNLTNSLKIMSFSHAHVRGDSIIAINSQSITNRANGIRAERSEQWFFPNSSINHIFFFSVSYNRAFRKPSLSYICSIISLHTHGLHIRVASVFMLTRERGNESLFGNSSQKGEGTMHTATSQQFVISHRTTTFFFFIILLHQMEFLFIRSYAVGILALI